MRNKQNRVFVLDSVRKPLAPCRPARARLMLKKGTAAVLRRYPFTIILKKILPHAEVEALRLKIDPGSKTTGLAIVEQKFGHVVFAAELMHRGEQVRKGLSSRRSLRQFRRYRKTRYRAPRFNNRRRSPGLLPPSLMHRVYTVTTWARRLQAWSRITAISTELARFDTQALQDPEVSGVEYQQGTLAGYEVREYLLEKWGRRCAYCGAQDVALEIDHIVSRARGGSNRVSNLTLACRGCNQEKNNQDVRDFVRDSARLKRILTHSKAALGDAAAINATRWALFGALKAFGLPVETGSGGRTKFNRIKLGLPKFHWTDAACVGRSGSTIKSDPNLSPLLIRACGHGSRQMCGTDAYGFPIRHRTRQKRHFGFQTGDIVRGEMPSGKYKGVYLGRVICRASGRFDVASNDRRIPGISHRHCRPVHMKDGYSYR
jgi:5-methylcytosine-specific restriction endonuclease McrA